MASRRRFGEGFGTVHVQRIRATSIRTGDLRESSILYGSRRDHGKERRLGEFLRVGEICSTVSEIFRMRSKRNHVGNEANLGRVDAAGDICFGLLLFFVI